ncbi:MAG: metallophosphoesterase [Bacteroidales bacterium]
MKSKIRKILLILIALLILIDMLSIRVLNFFLEDPDPLFTKIFSAIHWGISFIFMIIFFSWMLFPPDLKNPKTGRLLNFISGFFVLLYFPKLLLVIFNAVDELLFQTARFMTYEGDPFFVLTYGGIVISLLAFLALLYGITIGRYDLRLRKQRLIFSSLPAAFDGFKIVHFSDLHTGSLPPSSSYPSRLVRKINALDPDLVVFTGDLINYSTDEAAPWHNTLKKIRARQGKYAVTGNHDYGNHTGWNTEEERMYDQKKLRQLYEKCGFTLLENQSVDITQTNSSIALTGVNNHGLSPFPQLGNLSKAMEDARDKGFHILLSHDPSHWEAEVKGKTKIGLTLSGHTHGFQFGIHMPGFKWSPVQYMYPQWLGLYTHLNQYLYVSAGCGTIGFPGRTGIPPEITQITLQTK